MPRGGCCGSSCGSSRKKPTTSKSTGSKPSSTKAAPKKVDMIAFIENLCMFFFKCRQQQRKEPLVAMEVADVDHADAEA